MIHNIFNNIQPTSSQELTDVILHQENIHIERIVSYGIPSDKEFWYNQKNNEWVLLLSGEAEIEFKDEGLHQLKAGDYFFIPAHQEHRVNFCSKEPNCIWLAVHF